MPEIGTALERLAETIAILRSPEGCPWDREQTLETMGEHLQEEVAELLEGIDRADWGNFEEELGDLLLLLVMFAQIAKENGHTTLARAADTANAKLIRRHPHVFEKRDLGSGDKIEAVWRQWEAIKADEKKSRDGDTAPLREPVLKQHPRTLPLLLRARDTFKDIKKKDLTAAAGIEIQPIQSKAETLSEDALGNELFELCAAARLAGLDPEAALRRHLGKLEQTLDPVGAKLI
jgi:MazG family protein